MTTITEQKFTCNVNYQFDISLDDLRCLFCTMGQGVNYWACEVTIGNIEEEEDEDGNIWFKDNQDYFSKESFLEYVELNDYEFTANGTLM